MSFKKNLTFALCVYFIFSALPAFSLPRPNVLVIVADDLGLGDISLFHEKYTNAKVVVPTPSIDSLAREGMSFFDAHSPTALCAPSRYAFMSGNYNYRSYAPWGVWSSFRKNAVTPKDATIGRVAKSVGYNTAFVGKWHLGGDFYKKGTSQLYTGSKTAPDIFNVDISTWVGGNPRELGFDYDFTVPTGVQGPLYAAYENGRWSKFHADSKIVYVEEANAIDPLFVSDKGPGMGDSHWDGRNLNMLLASKAEAFIRQQSPGKPFLLQYWSPAVHLPHIPPESIKGSKIAGTTPSHHLDMNRVLDLEVKTLIDALKAKGVYNNTLIIFTSDNGGLLDKAANVAGHNSPGQWSGSKNLAFEGGHRVPFIAVWPNKIKPGSQSSELVNGTDIVATVADAIGAKMVRDQAMDSWNLLPLLLGQPFDGREYLMQQAGNQQDVMFREGAWKLIIDTDFKLKKRVNIALYDLEGDPKERKNLISSAKYQDKIKSMSERYWSIREGGKRTAPLTPSSL